ncbi:MAG: MnhB domain-containing protein [Bacteroidota bacterium]
MTPRTRSRLGIAALIPLGGLLVASVAGLYPFGGFNGFYGTRYNHVTVEQRHIPSAVTAVVFDYRGLDTMGEELILLAAVAGIALLLRQLRDEGETGSHDARPGRPDLPPSEGIQTAGIVLLGFGFVYGWYIVVFGHLSPGGGFQGGAAIASALIMLYVAGSHKILESLAPRAIFESVEAIAVAGYICTGLSGLIMNMRFMENVLPLGQRGHLLSGGMIPLLNVLVGISVATGFVLVAQEFVHQAVTVREET